MTKAKVAEVDLGGIGEIDPGTRKAGIIVWRIVAAGSLLVLLAGLRPANQTMRQAGLGLHAWAGQLADRMLHQHTYRQIVDLAPKNQRMVADWLPSSGVWLMYAAGAAVVVYVLMAVAKLRRPGAAKADGRRNVLGITAAVLVVLAVLAVGALQVEPGREVVALSLRALAQVGSAIHALAAGLWER